MITKNRKVSLRQVETLLLLDAFGLGSLALSRRAIEYADADAWIVVLMAGLIAIIYGYFVASLCNRFPGKTIIGMTEEILNKGFAKIFAIILLIRFTIVIALEIRIFGEIIKNVILSRTPIEVIIITMLITLAYMVVKGYEYRAKLAEILIYVVFIPIIIIFLFALKDTDVTNLLPSFVTNPSKILFGGYVLSSTFKMIEILFFSNFFINTNKGFMKITLRATVIATIFNVLVTMLVIVFLTPNEASHHIWPIITMAKSINFPGLLIERQELLFIIFLINSIFVMISGQAIVTNILVKDIFNFKKTNYLYFLLFIVIYKVSLIPDNIVSVYEILERITLFSPLIFMFIVPLIYLIIAKIRKKGILNE